jgi:peptidoglycan/LPS O-acetylase OafA/YrhL
MARAGELSLDLKRGQYVPALDGLRALSVLAVIAFHADLAWAPGGFLGVEVFFVVSGYLITALLLVELRDMGLISLPKFWLRRARRLLPALLALLCVVLGASLLIAPDSLGETRGDTLAALLYVSNWWQVIHHHSYFMAVQRPPLLLHLWSLAVEEQFYLFWPVLIALLGRAAPRWLPTLALAVALASAVWMAWLFDPSLDPTRVYIGTDSRLSGLLLGSALAATTRAPLVRIEPLSGLARALQEGLAASALCALLVAFQKVKSHDAFVYRGGLVVVDIATCALITGLVARTSVASLLGARPLAWLGRRSYGLYLWHWPVFALTRPEQDLALTGTWSLALRLALTFVTAEVCYRYVELPIRGGALAMMLARLRTRPLLLGVWTMLIAALAITVVCLSSARLAAARLDCALPSLRAAGSPVGGSGSEGRDIPRAAESALGGGVALDPRWPKTLTLLSDSVTLGVSKSLSAALPDWKVEVLGRPALMVKQVVPEFLNARSVGSVVVIGLAYNSLFERDRKNYERWSGVWDRGAERLLSDLKACGAKKLVWVTLREPSPEFVTDAGRDQYREYAWFFPYVNERIHALAARHPELTVADWQAVSNVPGITKDLIHLNPAGTALMTSTITRAVLEPRALP